MSMQDWESLNARHFGDIYFCHGAVPPPNLIADGDLDDDLCFVMWDTEIVKSVKMSNVVDLDRRARLFKKRATAKQDSTAALRNNPNCFLNDLRSAVANVVSKFEFRNLLAISTVKPRPSYKMKSFSITSLSAAHRTSLLI